MRKMKLLQASPASHASRLRALFREALMVGIGVGACSAIIVACSGKVAEPSPSSGGDSGVDGCHSIPADVKLSCSPFRIAFGGDPSTCGFDGGSLSGEECTKLCGRPISGSCSLDGTDVVCQDYCAVDGRRTAGLAECPRGVDSDLGAHFARMAFFEAASVLAFDRLHDELRHHGAPRSLLASIRRARRDEARHAAMASRLARKHGGVAMPAPRLEPTAPRALETIALENAAEGCGRETLGAMLGLRQSEHARTRSTRGYYAAIASDEARHAALSWRMHAWLLPQLSEEARRSALRAFHRSVAPSRVRIEGTPAFRAALGLPTDSELRACTAALVAKLAA